jgi:hypothetical protein
MLEMDSYSNCHFEIPRNLFVNGKNIIAVELHGASGSSSLAFDLSLFDPNTGSTLISTSNNAKYSASVSNELVLKAVYEKDPDWTPADVKLYINEVCASNNQYVDEYREDDDWIEIYNDGTTPVDLAGMYISDKRKNLTRYQIPTGQPEKTTIPAKGYLIIWADADSTTQGALHTNFKLSKSSSQTISLSREVNGVVEVIDSIRYVSHNEKETFSRFSYSGDGAWCITSRPTFAAQNAYFPTDNQNGNPTDLETLTEEVESIAQVYPNPVEDLLWFNLANEPSAMVTISDLTGRILLSKKVSSGENINVENLENNIYMIYIQTKTKRYSTKIVKQ